MKDKNFCSRERKCATAMVIEEEDCCFFEKGELMSVCTVVKTYYCKYNVDSFGTGDCSVCSNVEAFLEKKLEDL